MKIKISIPDVLYEPENAPLLTGALRGLEKESLRVTPDGQLAQTPHPINLGSTLTHPQITTDFSEALMELITHPSHSISDLLNQLDELHQFTYTHLGDELLWSNSMPCVVGDNDDIPLAYYGTSNRGKMKTVYRRGLGFRYGRTMQTVAGIHYNFSFSRAFWAFLHRQESSVEDLDKYISRRYFALIRNFRRYYWLLIYLFGASPAVCQSFVKGRNHNLVQFGEDENTLYLPYATSLRMGDLGYQSSAQESLEICYNTMGSYVETLSSAIFNPFPEYNQVGLLDSDGEFKQLNTNLLQIENEFYGSVRPKRSARSGETALTALCLRGVEYIEVRCLDLDPFSPTGVSREQIQFLDVFLTFCALQDSPLCDEAESNRILRNQKRVVTEGRNPELRLDSPEGDKVSMKTWAEALFQGLGAVAELLDTAHVNGEQTYSNALNLQLKKVKEPSLTPSAQVLKALESTKLPFALWAKQQSEANKAFFEQRKLSDKALERHKVFAKRSIESHQEEERQEQQPFSEYLRDYYAQYVNCCG